MVYENRLSAVLAGSTLILRERISYEFVFPRGVMGSSGVRFVDSGSEVAVFRVRHALSSLSVSRDDVLAVACESCDVILLFPRDVL